MDNQQFKFATPGARRSEMRQRIRAHHVEGFQLSGLRCFDHLRRCQPWLCRNRPASPQLLKRFVRMRTAHVGISRQAIRENAHIRSATRICVIAEDHVTRLARQFRTESHQHRDDRAGNFRAKDNRNIGLCFEPGFQ